MFAIISCLSSVAILPQNGFRRGCAGGRWWGRDACRPTSRSRLPVQPAVKTVATATYNISWKVCLILCRFMFPLRCKGTKNALIISHFGRKSSWKNVFWGLYALSICYKVPIYSFMKVKYVKSCLTSQGWKHTGPLFYRLRFKLLIINV